MDRGTGRGGADSSRGRAGRESDPRPRPRPRRRAGWRKSAAPRPARREPRLAETAQRARRRELATESEIEPGPVTVPEPEPPATPEPMPEPAPEPVPEPVPETDAAAGRDGSPRRSTAAQRRRGATGGDEARTRRHLPRGGPQAAGRRLRRRRARRPARRGLREGRRSPVPIGVPTRPWPLIAPGNLVIVVAAPYKRLLALRPARVPMLGALIGRLPIAALSLATIILVRDETGSFAVAGVGRGVAWGSPRRSRCRCRGGWSIGSARPPCCCRRPPPTRWRSSRWCWRRRVAPTRPCWRRSGRCRGPPSRRSAPACGPCGRSWSPIPELRQSAFALDAVLLEVCFIVGPLAPRRWSGSARRPRACSSTPLSRPSAPSVRRLPRVPVGGGEAPHTGTGPVRCDPPGSSSSSSPSSVRRRGDRGDGDLHHGVRDSSSGQRGLRAR